MNLTQPRTRATMLRARAALAAAVVACAACGSTSEPTSRGLAVCTATPPLTVSSIAVAGLGFINPLGSASAVFAKHHLGFHLPWVTGPVADVVAPGDIAVVEVLQQSVTGPAYSDTSDYDNRFYPCTELLMYWGHLTSGFSRVDDVGGSGGVPEEDGRVGGIWRG
jgi:hypothetical protein